MNQSIEKLKDEFWNYSCEKFAHKDIERLCLDLQNGFQCDVNMLLLICWLNHKNKKADDVNFISSATRLSQEWQQGVIEPLRNVRKQITTLKGIDAKKIKKSLLKSELEAEKSEQSALIDALCENAGALHQRPPVDDMVVATMQGLRLYINLNLDENKDHLKQEAYDLCEKLAKLVV